MRFTVEGASRATGEDVSILLDAIDAADAMTKANQMGIFVKSIAPEVLQYAQKSDSGHKPQSSAVPAVLKIIAAITFAFGLLVSAITVKDIANRQNLDFVNGGFYLAGACFVATLIFQLAAIAASRK